MAFREGWFESLKGVTRIALSLRRLGPRSVDTKTRYKIGGFQSMKEDWDRKRIEENAELRAELQRIRAVLNNRGTLAK